MQEKSVVGDEGKSPLNPRFRNEETKDRDEEEKLDMDEDELLDEMLMKAERLRIAMLAVSNPIPNTIETKDNMTECSSVDFSTVFFSKGVRKERKQPEKVKVLTEHLSEDNSLHGADFCRNDCQQEEKSAGEDLAMCDRRCHQQISITDDGITVEKGSPVAVPPPSIDDASAVAIKFASEWKGIATPVHAGDLDFSPVADYSAYATAAMVKWEKVVLASEDDEDYVSIRDYCESSCKEEENMVSFASQVYPLIGKRRRRSMNKKQRRIVWAAMFVVASAVLFWLNSEPTESEHEEHRLALAVELSVDDGLELTTASGLAKPRKELICLDESWLVAPRAEPKRADTLTNSSGALFVCSFPFAERISPTCLPGSNTFWNRNPQEKQQLLHDLFDFMIL